jgi:hypothetical protein
MINSPADALLQMSMYMHRWRVSVRPTDRELLDATLTRLGGSRCGRGMMGEDNTNGHSTDFASSFVSIVCNLYRP